MELRQAIRRERDEAGAAPKTEAAPGIPVSAEVRAIIKGLSDELEAMRQQSFEREKLIQLLEVRNRLLRDIVVRITESIYRARGGDAA